MEILNKSKQLRKEFNDNYSLSIFLQHINLDELTELLELILLGDKSIINHFFPGIRNVDPDEVAIDELVGQTPLIVNRISESISKIFLRAVENHYKEKSTELLQKILTLSYNDVGLSNSIIIDTLNKRRLPSSFKINLLYLLEDRNELSFIDNYIENYNVTKDPCTFPFVLSKIEDFKMKTHLLKQFDSIATKSPDSNTLNWFYSIIYDQIQSSLSSNNFEFSYELYKVHTTWLKEIVDRVLEQEEYISIKDKFVNKTYNTSINIEECGIDTAIDFIDEVNTEYLKPENAFTILSLTTAQKLTKLTNLHDTLIPFIEPKIRTQIAICQYADIADFYSFFSHTAEKINSVDDLTNILEAHLTN
jgi:hypothetical protein